MATKRYRPKGRVGSGERFERLTHFLEERGGVSSPEALAAWIGRRKYGKGRFQDLAARGRRRAK